MTTLNRFFRLTASRGLIAAILAAGFAGGCGKSTYSVKGRIVENGQPVQAGGNHGDLSVGFVGVGGGVENFAYPTLVQPDGSFRVLGPNRGGVKPGQYRVAVNYFPPGKSMNESADRFLKYADKADSLTVDIQADIDNLVVDPAQGTVTK